MACKHKKRLWENGWCNVACRYCTFTQESTCKHNKQTNADRLRAMPDEELAKVIPCPYMRDIYDECKFGWHERTQTCEECTLEWLKQPAKDGENNGRKCKHD